MSYHPYTEWDDFFDHLADRNLEFDYEFLYKLANDHWDKRKLVNEEIGQLQAVAELSRRDFLNRGKEEKIGKGKKWYWVTVNPKDTITTDVFVSQIKKMYNKKWAKDHYYIFEIGKNGHQHSHGLIETDYQIARAIRELSNSVKDCCNVNIPACFKVVTLTDPSIALQKLDYMKGLKQEDKQDAVSESKKWREQNGLAEFYSQGALTLLAPVENREDGSTSGSNTESFPDYSPLHVSED